MSDQGIYAFPGVDGDKLHEVHRSFSAKLFGELGQNPRWSAEAGLVVEEIAGLTGNTHKVKMAAGQDEVTEWEDERIYSKFQHYDQQVDIKRWQNAVQLDLDKLDDEMANLNQYNTLIGEMAEGFDEHPHRKVVDMIVSGLGTSLGTCYDGQALFSTSHPLMNGSTQSNKGELAFNRDNLYTAIKAMRKIKKPNGQIANVIPTHIIAPVALTDAVEYVLKSDFFVDGNGTKSNTLKDRVKPIFDPRIDETSETAWFLLDASKRVKPIFKGTRRAVTPRVKVNEYDRQGFWGADARYGFSYGYYHTMWGTDGVP